MITFLVIFGYSFLIYEYFSERINDGDFGTNVCSSLVACYLNSINLGLRLGGGFSEALFLVGTFDDKDTFYGRFFFDITFFILVQLIFLNLIAGIIIDTFNELRDL